MGDGPVRIAVIGAGHLGTYHLQKLRDDPLAELLGVVDISEAKRAKAATDFHIEAQAEIVAFTGRLDAVVIAAPTVAHRELALTAFELGLHVLVEKPLTSTVAEARDVIAAAASAERILQVGHTERFNPAVAAALPLLQRPGYVVAERLGPFSGRSTDIDVVLDLMIHDLDIVAALVDSPLKEARAVGVPVFTAETDMAAARLEFENGAVAQLSASRGSLEPSRKIRVFSRERYVSIDCQSRDVKSVLRGISESKNGSVQLSGETIDVPDGDPLALQDHDFLCCIREARSPRIDGRQGMRALELAEAVKAALSSPI